jgi:flagellar basal body P-ring formation protein FlgA
MIKTLLLPTLLCLTLLPVASTDASGSLASDIEHQLRAEMPQDGNEYLITVPAFVSTLPSVYDSIKVEPLGDARPLGNCWVKVYFFKSDGIFQTANLNLQINLYQKVLAARESIKQGQNLTPELFDVVRREVTSLADPPIVSPRELVGKSAARQIVVGKTLTHSCLQKQEIVKRGDLVSIEYSSGSIKITASGEAKEAGGLGETIKVKNMSSSKIISAVVQDDKTVKINK